MNTDYNYISDLPEQILEIPTDSIVSRTIHNDENVRVILFGFAPGQELSEHTASMPAIIHILSGSVKLIIGKDPIEGDAGTWAHMPANMPHSVFAKSQTMMLLTMIKTVSDN